LTFLDSLTILGIEDGVFKPFKRDQRTLICCTSFKKNILVDLQFVWIKVDGIDVTNKVLTVLAKQQKDIIILGGISFAGFNLIDVKKINEETGCPIIMLSRKKPNRDSMRGAIRKHFSDWKERLTLLRGLGKSYTTITYSGSPPVYFGVFGTPPEFAEAVLKYSSPLCRIPEPIRTASIIAKGLTRNPEGPI